MQSIILKPTVSMKNKSANCPPENSSGATLTAGKLEQAAKLFKLTRREIEVLCLLAEGDTAKSAADKLTIAPGTVQKHVDRIHLKVRQSNTVSVLYLLLARDGAPTSNGH
jgi:two-component system response regulator NreC